MISAEKIYELIKDMPPHQIGEVFDFAESLKQRSSKKNSELSISSSEDLQLEPLLVSEGYVPDGWKDAIYGSINDSEQ